MSVHSTLKFMSHALNLKDTQITEMARLIGALETERAQVQVDHQRSLGTFADALSAAEFDSGKAKQGVETRAASGDRLRKTIYDTLQATHAILDADQRRQIAHLLRTGALSI